MQFFNLPLYCRTAPRHNWDTRFLDSSRNSSSFKPRLTSVWKNSEFFFPIFLSFLLHLTSFFACVQLGKTPITSAEQSLETSKNICTSGGIWSFVWSHRQAAQTQHWCGWNSLVDILILLCYSHLCIQLYCTIVLLVEKNPPLFASRKIGLLLLLVLLWHGLPLMTVSSYIMQQCYVAPGCWFDVESQSFSPRDGKCSSVDRPIWTGMRDDAHVDQKWAEGYTHQPHLSLQP